MNTPIMSGNHYLRLLLASVLMVVLSAAASQAEISASATLSHTSFPITEKAQLVITVAGARSVNLEIPETEGFTLSQRGRSSQFNMVNGKVSSTVTFTCIIEPYKAGSYTTPPITISADGTTLTTDSLPFEVTKPSPRSAPGTAASPPPGMTTGGIPATFITVHPQRTQTYLGEITPVEIKAYFRQGLRANLNSTPQLKGDGLVMAQLHDQPRQTQEYINETIYNVLIWETSLSSIKEGEHAIRLSLEATQLIPQRRNSSSVFGRQSPFEDDVFDSFFGGGYKRVPLTVSSKDLPHRVLPLPEIGQPPSFTGAIGEFTFTTSAQPTAVEVGEPLTFNMTIKGKGNFDRVETPQFPEGTGWKTYTPNVAYHGHNEKNYEGKKIFEQAIVAGSSDVREIPSMEFSFFNPATGKYVTHTTSPIPVSISGPPPGSTLAQPSLLQPTGKTSPQSTGNRIPGQLDGLAPIQLHPGKATLTITPAFLHPFFLFAVAVCGITLLASIFYRFCWRVFYHNPEKHVKKICQRERQDDFAQVKEAYDKSDSVAFLTSARLMMQHHLGRKWHCEPSSITRVNLCEKLPQDDPVLMLFTQLEMALYSGTILEQQTMQRFLHELEAVLEEEA